jgi:hypothetical protein
LRNSVPTSNCPFNDPKSKVYAFPMNPLAIQLVKVLTKT